MNPRAREVDAAFKWNVPLHIWDGTGEHPNEDQKAEMLAYVISRSKMDGWEDHVKAKRLEALRGKKGRNITLGAGDAAG